MVLKKELYKLLIVITSLLMLSGCDPYANIKQGIQLYHVGNKGCFNCFNDTYHFVLGEAIYEFDKADIEGNDEIEDIVNSSEKVNITTEFVQKLDDNSIEYHKYFIKSHAYVDGYTDLKISVDDNTNDVFRIHINNPDEDPYPDILSSVYYNKGSFYLTVRKYSHTTPPHIDLRINGPEYKGSELYIIDMENRTYSLIYSTDNDKVIVYGDLDVVYYADEHYDIYRYDLDTNKDKLVCDADNDEWINIDYSRGKLFVESYQKGSFFPKTIRTTIDIY